MHRSSVAVPVAFAVAVVCLARSSAEQGGGKLPSRLEDYITTHVKLTAAQRKELLAGRPVTQILQDVDPSQEVSIFGGIWVNAPMSRYVQLIHNIEEFEKGGNFRVTKRISDPPRAEDFAQLDLPDTDVADLRTCRVGACELKLSEEALNQSKRYTDRIRGRVLGLKTRLAAIGDDSFERSTRHVERTRWVVATLALGALALLVFLYFILKRQLKLREQLASLLQSENRQLDALVRERTDELSDLASYLTNVREAEKLRQDNAKAAGKKAKKSSAKALKDANIAALERQLSDALGLVVEINDRGRAGGTLGIRYRTLDQLDEVVRRLQRN